MNSEVFEDKFQQMRGEFTLKEIKNGKEEVIVQDHNMIVNFAKQSLAEILSGARMGEVGSVYDIQPINRFELGSGSHSGLTKIDPEAYLTSLRAKTNLETGADSDADAQVYRIDFNPYFNDGSNQGTTGEVNDGTLTLLDNSYIKEYDSEIIKAGTNTPISAVDNPSEVRLMIESVANTGGTGTYKNSITYEVTLPEERANQNSTDFVIDVNPVYYSEAGLFIRKGDLDNHINSIPDMFAMKTFPPRPKAEDTKWVITWKIIF